MKGAYISTVFATLVVERNLIYLCPILFAATALAFARGIGRGWAIAGAGVFTLYVVAATPLHLDNYPYYEAHGLSIAAFANREFGWPEGRIEGALDRRLRRRARSSSSHSSSLHRTRAASRSSLRSAAVVVVAWSLTGQVYAAEGERHFSQFLVTNFPKPYDWVERGDGRRVGRRHRPADPDDTRRTSG